ncbi:MAG: TIGR02099 family protein [Rubrivivax sp.]|nr:MAG: TIGR02099 family protein [Rubrivivax sp.]
MTFFSAALHHCSRAAGWHFRLLWRMLRWALLALALLWTLTVVAWVALHWGILPHANDWRPWLEKEASKALGVELRIGRITVESGGWMPRMELGDVRVLDPAGRPALTLARVSAVLSAQSLVVLQPRFSQLLVDAPELTIRRDAAGRIFIGGIGLDDAEAANTGTTEEGLDWLFSQPELAILGGRVRWVDERRAGAKPLELSSVNAVLRNGLRRHQLRLDGTPPADWGQRFTLMGQFTQSLLKRPGEFQHWSGQLYAELPRADLSQLRRHVDLPFQLSEGDGAVRAWADVKDGQPISATLDLALRAVRLKLMDTTPELNLDHIEGRLDLARTKDRLSLQARQLGFVSRDNDDSVVTWPKSDWGVALQLGKNDEMLGGEVNAQRLDFALMAQIAQRLPLGDRAHQLVAELEPRGVLTALSAQWQGELDAPRAYRVKAQLEGLALAPKASDVEGHFGRPGLRGASLELDASERGGSAKLAIHDGEIELPGVFEDPRLPITRLSTNLNWQLPQATAKSPGQVEVKLRDLQLQTPDLSGEFDATWRRPAGNSGAGFLDLSGKAQRGDATRVARYVPKHLHVTRSWLARALLSGEARGINVRLRGELADFPFDGPKSNGVFRVAFQAQNVNLAYVPPPESGGAPSWPAMDGVDAEVVFERGGMQINNGHAKVLGYELSGVNGGIQDLHHGRVLVLDGNGRGTGADLLHYVRASPLDEWLGHALSTTTAQGPVALKLGLNIPLDDTTQTTVKGQLQLGGVDLKLRPELPALSGARGRIDFDRKGLQLAGMTARLLGGDAGLEGGTQRDGSLRFAVQGMATADGLRKATELGAVARMAQAASGQAPYRFQLAVGKEGRTELSVSSSLQGLALDLPAPGRKEADATLPLRLLIAPTEPGHDEIRLEVGLAAAPLLQAQLQRDVSGSSSQVLRAALAVQDKLPALPTAGVLLQANVGPLDLDAWRQRLGALAGNNGEGGEEVGLLPSQISLRSQALKVGGRQLGRVSAVVVRDGANWRLNVDAEQLTGRIELKGVRGGQIDAVQARLTRLSLPRSEAETVSDLIDPGKPTANSSPLPSLDIQVDDFELRGKRLGRLEVLAYAPAAARDWKLEKLQIDSPDATLNASGRWSGDDRRRTTLDWKLDVHDGGKLLERLGHGQALRGGKGALVGQVGWDGSPLAPHYASMGGAFNIQLDTGTFLKAEPGVGRLLGVLSLQSLPRRLLLDFRDVFAEGFTFDGVTGDVKIAGGVARSENIRIRGLQAAVLVEGSTDLAAETQKLRVVVVPEVSAGGASLAYAAINPAIALGAFLAQMILSRPLAASNTREFHITGSWDDPKVEKVEAPASKAASAP